MAAAVVGEAEVYRKTESRLRLIITAIAMTMVGRPAWQGLLNLTLSKPGPSPEVEFCLSSNSQYGFQEDLISLRLSLSKPVTIVTA